MPASTRDFFEPRFGARFDNVRVHTNADAGRLTDGVSARAFTVGRDIFFGQSEYQPGTTAGRRLLAHELTHTIQQSRRHQLQRQLEEEAPPANARAIYETYQSDLIELGKELYRLVSESAANASLVLQVLDEVPWLYRDDVAYHFVQPLSDDRLLDIASGEQGRDLLGRFRKELEGGAPWPSEKKEIERIDQALEATAPAPELALPEPSAPPFPSDVNPISGLEGEVTKQLYVALRTAWSWLESDPSITSQLLTSIQHTVETMRPLIECVSARGDNSAVKDLDELATELEYAIEQLTDQADRSFEALRQNFEWIAFALVDLDPILGGLERSGSVGSCVAIVLGPFAEGVIESLTAIDPAQVRRFSGNITNNPFFAAGFTLGAQAGILIDAKEVVFSVLAALRHPLAAVPNLMQDLRNAMQQADDLVDELTGPTGADTARGIGRGIGTQFGVKLAELNEANGPFMFAFELGELVGPAIVYTVLSLLGFEEFIAGRLLLLAGDGLKSLKAFPRLASLFKRTPDAAPLPSGTPEGVSAPTPGAPEASPPTPLSTDAPRHVPDATRVDPGPVTPTAATSRVAAGLSAEVNLGEQLGVHTLSLVEQGGKLIVRVCCDPPCGKLVERISNAIIAAKKAGGSVDVYEELLEETERLQGYWDVIGEDRARAALEKLSKRFEDAHAESPGLTRAVVEPDTGVRPPAKAARHITGYGIKDGVWLSIEAVVKAMYGRVHRGIQVDDIRLILNRGIVEDESIKKQLDEVGEIPELWESVHYMVFYANGEQEQFSVFRKVSGETAEFRAPHP